MSWIFIHLPRFALEVRARTLTTPCPLALVAPNGQRILLADAEAERLGVRPGISATTARCLAPGLRLIEPDVPLQERSLRDLAQLLYTEVAEIALKPPQGLLLNLQGMLSLTGGLDNLWRRLTELLTRQELQAWLATGHTPLMAQLLAQAGGTEPRLDGQYPACLLHQLPIRQAGLPREQTERLTGLGIRRLGQLLALPPAETGQRLGPELLDHLDRLRGRKADPQVFFVPPPVFERRIEFLEEVEQIAALLFPLRRPLRELEDFLRRRQRALARLEIGVLHRQRPATRFQVQSALPCHRAEDWLQLCRLRLERARLEAPALALELHADEWLPLPALAEDLFQQPAGQGLSPQQLLSRLQARLGHERIRNPALRADHRPERAFVWQDPGQAGPALLARPPRPARRPFWLLERPRPVEPRSLRLLEGPERIQAGWWDREPDLRDDRDYYLARTADGGLAWVFRTWRGRWFLHGWFA